MNHFFSANHEILTVDEIAVYLKVTTRSIYSLLSKEEIPAFKVGGAWRFRRDEIDKWTREARDQDTQTYNYFTPKTTKFFPANFELENLISQIVNEPVTHEQVRSEITESFFKHPQTIKDKTNHGIVETPFQVAKFIVNLAFKKWSNSNKSSSKTYFEIDWFDPCCGGGVFAESILEVGFDLANILREEDLPKITMAEISLLGIASALRIIKSVLAKRKMCLEKYIKSGRLKIIYGDTLSIFPERKEIFMRPNASYDIIVGNPPYVRSTNLDKKYKVSLKELFPSIYSGNADLYSYFIASGLLGLNTNGVLSFISPAGFVRSKNSENLRKWLSKNVSLDTYYDLDETKAFVDADLHAAIYVILNKRNQQQRINYIHISDNNQLQTLFNNGCKEETAFIEQPKSHGWIFHKSASSKNAFENQFENCKTLKDFGITVYSGIRPGLSEAYIIDESRYHTFSDKIKKKWFKQVVLPAHINRWTGMKSVHYMLVIPSGTQTVDQEILDYLEPYKECLVQRSEVSTGVNWCNLRPCTYYHKMEEEKIIFPDLSSQQRFSLSDKSVYVPDGAYFIASSDLTLLGILNSSLAKYYFINRCSSIGNLNSKGRFRFKKTFVQSFPIPRHYNVNSSTREEIAKVVRRIVDFGETTETTDQLNTLVHEFYKDTL